MLRRLLKFFRTRRAGTWAHTPIISIELKQAALLHNVQELQKLAPELTIAPVLKSNAYGHGLTHIAEILDQEPSIPFFCIDSYYEAQLLRNHGVRKPLLIVGYSPTATILKNALPHISFVIGSLTQLEELWKGRSHALLHVKFDTGMHRQGIVFEERDEAHAFLTKLNIQGILSHLADAETPGSKITNAQIQKWNTIAEQFDVPYKHLSNSAGLAHTDRIHATTFRVGKALYGFNPGNLNRELKPVLSLHSTITELRTVTAGEAVGYNGTFITTRATRIATIPVGYFEGLDKRLRNRGYVKIGEQFAPLIGKVSMNISLVDVTDLPEVTVGTRTTLISDRAEDLNSIKTIAQTCETIPSDILVHIPAHLRRTVV